MMLAIGLLCVAAVAAAVQVGYVAPATSYVYRSDHGGPASLIQLGPQAYTESLSLGHPLKTVEAYELAPLPLPYVNAKPIAIEDAEEDNENADYDSDEGYGHENGGGSDYSEQHHDAHGEKGSKGYATKGHHAKGSAGDYGKSHGKGFYHEVKGEKGAHHDEADAYGKHHESGKGYKGGDHGHKKHFSKGEDVTGYHKVFHKDEFKKDHDFYDVAAKDGHFKKHGYQKTHHASEKGAHEKGGHNDAAFDKGGFGKSGFNSESHGDEEDEGHSAEEAADSHYEHQKDYAKKGGSDHEKEFAYEDADDEDEDE